MIIVTQSVVKGAPLVISIRTSSVSPLLEASSSLLPRSTSDMLEKSIQDETTFDKQDFLCKRRYIYDHVSLIARVMSREGGSQPP